MLLETLDVRRNDILIYSQNDFDFENNFKIIYKRERVKRPKKISYFEVCEFVKDATPKNLILYRLLTNVKGLDAFSTKYGYFIKIDHGMELIYFDPVFALKDLKHLKFNLQPEEFRFKIQQVGLTSSSHNEDEAVYSEIYNFDLKADEAKTQNDKIFADAIFIFDDNYEDVIEVKSVTETENKKMKFQFIDEPVLKLKNVIEEPVEPQKEILKVNLYSNKKTPEVRDEKVEMLKKALGITKVESEHYKESSLIDELKRTNESTTETDEDISAKVFDLFKTTSKFDQFNNRKDESHILKIDDD